MSTRFRDSRMPIERLDVSAYTVPTDSPESDGTYSWDRTTIVVVEAHAGGKCGLGYSYADTATATLIQTMLEEALVMANIFVAESGVTWFEEPVSSDDLEGLQLIRNRAPAGMDIAAGEYGYDLWYFRRMLEANAVDVLQADATRCAGITGFMRAGVLCESRSLELSSHCGPALHVHPCCAIPNFRHMEYFHDHVRIEHLLFDGVLTPVHGELRPDLSRPGMGLEFKRSDAAKYAV